MDFELYKLLTEIMFYLLFNDIKCHLTIIVEHIQSHAKLDIKALRIESFEALPLLWELF